MFTIYVVFKCYEGKREAFVERVRKEGILDEIRAEDGCLRYEYYYPDENKNELLLIEAWESEAHQQAHLKTAHMNTLKAFKNEYIYDTKIGEFTIK